MQIDSQEFQSFQKLIEKKKLLFLFFRINLVARLKSLWSVISITSGQAL